jgi:hypothetical protein
MADRRETFVSTGAFCVMVRLLAVASALWALTAETGAAQEPSPAVPQNVSAIPAIPSGISGRWMSSTTAASAEGRPWPVVGSAAGELSARAISKQDSALHPVGIQRITLEQVKQQSANRAINPLARLGQLQVEAAKQHRLGTQADYFPKFAATFANLHYTEFLGEVVERQRLGLQIPVELFSRNWTVAALRFTQPITPVFQVRQAVRIARADERIAVVKAGFAVSKTNSDAEVEANYFRLLIAQCRLISAKSKVRAAENRPEYAMVSTALGRATGQELEWAEAREALVTATAEVKDLTASLNRELGWRKTRNWNWSPPSPWWKISLWSKSLASQRPLTRT